MESRDAAPVPYHERPKCEKCGRPGGPFGSCGFPDFCDCDQREGSTFAPSAARGCYLSTLELHELDEACAPFLSGERERRGRLLVRGRAGHLREMGEGPRVVKTVEGVPPEAVREACSRVKADTSIDFETDVRPP